MPALVSRVDRRLQVTVVALAGSLDAHTAAEAEAVLWDCLAEMPEAVVIDCAELTCDVDGRQWLTDLQRRAADWPGVTVSLAGDRGVASGRANGHAPIRSFATVESALRELGEMPPDHRRQVWLPPHPDSCGLAREFVARACQDWGLRRPRRLAELLISELVANGVMHARTELTVTVRRREDWLELSVRDRSPKLLPPAQDDPRGFGLQLVERLSDRWGWLPAGRGKVVWSRLPGID